MVDFVKVWLRNGLFLKNDPTLDFRAATNTRTGEIETFEVAKYKGLEFKIWDTGFLQISGSLHKYKNNGRHNHDAFTYSMLCEVLYGLESLFRFDLKKCELHNIEFGVNILPFMHTNLILDNLMSHKNLKFDSQYGGNYKYVEHSQYSCKLYNKAAQYRLTEQIMRWELKFVKMQKLNQLGIYSLSDLTKIQWIKPIGELLLEEWNNILLYDKTIQASNLDTITRDKKLLEWGNPNFWMSLSRMQRLRNLKSYLECVENNSLKVQYQNGMRIEKKWNELQFS